ncbi:hypothetical protein J4760_08270 [Salinicoccus sp. ID82-1]|uniref:Uncharacterized protein n=1 Tax=Salinicoccus cyprini TaxID=2493691 RepID=A0A558AX43_9STAP|nr:MULTISPECIES: hypothetical protein [Salinicoccus]MCG1010013.1 hypothetical protein [Salinicoccus sp. ID82-1]TVT28819.1 hypothetical protein FO441_00640 [Salinicoccus cyprini]
MGFFKYLTWDNAHMDLRYEQDPYDGHMNITNVYQDSRKVDMTRINDEYSGTIRDAQRVINANRIGMLIIYLALVFLPALIISVMQENILLLGVIIIYTILAYFVVEAVNQVKINQVLHKLDQDLKASSHSIRQG